jgi:hypothetical protein
MDSRAKNKQITLMSFLIKVMEIVWYTQIKLKWKQYICYFQKTQEKKQEL